MKAFHVSNRYGMLIMSLSYCMMWGIMRLFKDIQSSRGWANKVSETSVLISPPQPTKLLANVCNFHQRSETIPNRKELYFHWQLERIKCISVSVCDAIGSAKSKIIIVWTELPVSLPAITFFLSHVVRRRLKSRSNAALAISSGFCNIFLKAIDERQMRDYCQLNCGGKSKQFTIRAHHR